MVHDFEDGDKAEEQRFQAAGDEFHAGVFVFEENAPKRRGAEWRSLPICGSRGYWVPLLDSKLITA